MLVLGYRKKKGSPASRAERGATCASGLLSCPVAGESARHWPGIYCGIRVNLGEFLLGFHMCDWDSATLLGGQVGREVSQVLEVNLKELATKEDLRSGLSQLEMKLDTRFEKVLGEIVLLKWMLGILIAGVVSLIIKSWF